MRLCRLTINNYRGIEALELDLSEHAVLVGPNECGKTSVLRALDLLLGATYQRLYSSLELTDFNSLEDYIYVQAQLTEMTDDELSAFPDEVDLTTWPPTLTYRLEVHCLDSDTGELDIRRYFPTAGHERSATRDQQAAIRWFFVPADRELTRDLSAGRRGVLQRLLTSIELTDLQSLNDAMATLRDAFKNQAELEHFRTSLSSALAASLTTGSRPTAELVLRGELEANPLGNLDIALSRGRGVARRLLHQQSEGAKALAAIAIYSLAASSTGILAVDEPEMHLHPTAQRAVGKLLTQSSGQSIAATHSPSVVAQSDPAHVIAFTPTGSTRSLPPNAPALKPVFTARWWNAGMVELLTAHCIAMVEGPSDRVLVDRATEDLAIDFPAQGIAILDLDGGDKLKHALSALGPNGFNIVYRALGDEDKRERWASFLDEPSPARLEDHGVVLSQPDLEGEYVSALGWRRVVHILARSGFVKLRAIRDVTGVSSLQHLIESDVLTVCRKYKVEAATAIAAYADPQEIRSISSVVKFVRALPT